MNGLATAEGFSGPEIKVLHVVHEAWIWPWFFRGQPGYMRDRNVQLTGVSKYGDLATEFSAAENMPVFGLDISRAISPLRDLRTIRHLVRLIRRMKPDIVHAHMSKAGLLGMIAAKLAGGCIRVYENHGMAAVSTQGLLGFVLRCCERITCRLAHRVVFVAGSVRDAAIAHKLCPADKAYVILSANGLDSQVRFNPAVRDKRERIAVRERHGIPADACVLGYVGRLLRIKGIEELSLAWMRAREEVPGLHLLLVGARDERDPLSPEVISRLTSDPRVHFAGYVAETAPYYAAMDILTLPSRHEGLGYSLIEASSMTLPVIGTRIPGIVDAIREGETGMLVEWGDVDGLERSVVRYAFDPELRARHGAAGRRFVEGAFRQERVWGELLGTYRSLLDRYGARAAAAG